MKEFPKLHAVLISVATLTVGCATQQRYSVTHNIESPRIQEVAILKNTTWTGKTTNTPLRLSKVEPLSEDVKLGFKSYSSGLKYDPIGGPEFVELLPGQYLISIACSRGNLYAYPKIKLNLQGGHTYTFKCNWTVDEKFVGVELASETLTPVNHQRNLN